MKKQLLALLLTASFSAINSVSAMEADNENFRNQYLVHLSNVIAKDSTKIAGAQKRSYNAFDGFKEKSFPVDPEGSNVRERITLHHCFGTVVPESAHGAPIESPYGRIKLPSYLYTDKEMCAFLDPLAEFLNKGEIVSGTIADISTIDRHKYGKNAIVILPLHRENEFKKQNPDFEGECILFDPEIITIAGKVDEVIGLRRPGQTTIKDLYQKINEELMSGRTFETYNNIKEFFKENNVKFEDHESTPHRALEHLLFSLWKQIHSARNGKDVILFHADQIPSRLAMIRNLLDFTLDFSWPCVGEQAKLALNAWHQDTLNWLNLFELDRGLRTDYHTSLFMNNPHLELFISNRADQKELLRLAFLHLNPEQSIEKLNLQSDVLFPELLSSGIISLPEMSDFLHHTDFQVLSSLKKRLVQQGYTDHGNGLLLLRLFKDLSKAVQDGYIFDKDRVKIKKLTNCLKGLSPASRLQDHVKPMIESFLLADKSYHNKGTLDFLNGEFGQLLQRKIFGQEKTWNFMDLLREYEGTKILFPELKCESADEETKPLFQHFAQIVSKWMFEKAWQEPHFQSPSQAIENPQPHYSLVNVGEAYHTMARKLELYERYLLYPFGTQPANHPLDVLVKEGCFESWSDLFHRLVPKLETLDEEDMKELNILPIQYSSLSNLYFMVNDILDKRNAMLKKDEEELAKYNDAVNKAIEKEKEMHRLIQSDSISYFDLLDVLDFFVVGEQTCLMRYSTRELLEIITEPNSAMAWYACEKAERLIDQDDLWCIKLRMKPVFKKAIVPFNGS